MSEEYDLCRAPSCTRPRVRLSVFCDEHHGEQLRRFGLAFPPPPDPRHAVRRSCDGQLRAWEAGALDTEELLVTLYDLFVIAHLKGNPWDLGLERLPAGVAKGLREYVRAHPPRVMNPRPADPARRAAQEREAEVAREMLVARLAATGC